MNKGQMRHLFDGYGRDGALPANNLSCQFWGNAIFVLEGATETYDRIDEIPDVLSRRLLPLRGFSADGMLLDADVLEGKALGPAIKACFGNPRIAYLHAHNARQGCNAARIERV